MISRIVIGLTAAWTVFPFLASAQSATEADDLMALVSGVAEIGKPGSPGPLVVWGERAFPVVVGESGGSVEPLVAGARWGEGRVVAFGHNGYLATTGADTARFRQNAVRWASGKGEGKRVMVGLWKGADTLAGELEAAGFRSGTTELDRLGRFDVLVFDSGALKEEKDRERVQKFVEGGGGIICGSVGWGWLQLNPGKTVQEHPGNVLLASAGIAWADGTLDPTEGESFAAKSATLAHTGRAISRIAGSPDQADVTQSLAVISRALRTIDQDAPGFGEKLEALVASGGDSPPVPSGSNPIREDDALGRVLLSITCGQVTTADPEAIEAHPAAKEFPGEVKRGARPETVSRQVSTATPGWHSLGLYAPPGGLVHVRVPEAATGAKLKVRIGCHSDRLYHKEKWERAPEISFSWPLGETVTKVANPFGGLVYIDVPDRCTLGEIEVDVAGTVGAPLYVHGVTSASEWKAAVRSTAAPWSEFASERLIVSVPTEVARRVGDPQKLMDTWDEVLRLEDELAAISREGKRPERIVCDQQISAGYMHSGYPVMVWMDQAKNLADADHLAKEGNWGFFHEFGHNHQRRDWTFSGTTEVTCNLFSLYVYEKLCGIPPEKHERGNQNFREEKMREYFLFKRGEFDAWKSSPFVALVMYIQLQQEFGWEAYKRVFAEYEALPDSERPGSDGEKHDQWMVRFSKTVERDLGPFFQTWGIPVSERALADIENLEDWIPAELKPFARK